MNTVKVRNIEIGAGIPKICVPIVGVTKEEIIAEAKTFDSIPVDVVEWRVDWFENVFEFDKVEDVLKDLREALGETPILFTFRTSKEGGEKAIEPEPYKELNIQAAKSGYVDLVDVEVFTGDEIVKEIIENAHACGVKVVASNHDFDKTPEKDEIVRRLHHHVNGRNRSYQPSLRRGIRICADIWRSKESICTRTDGCGRSENCFGITG